MLAAVTGRFEKGMKRATRGVKRFDRTIDASARRVRMFGLALSGAAVAGMTVMVKRQFAMIDTLAKVSDKLGITTEDLA